ncbi:Zinc-responsive transcriptional regulator ZAP1 [Pleurostoma richardsiae]|uniref:Zinc-responsive transcriptional regulator ZAP1 n=1 Tax=Pleurostoma richardsiae TaxID=41990 RepID=A0AA38VMQ2_9PEZI|nr:Zinc-responsive transcriptional regulator ZAP1 [Pleurostoma richardsiae]
MYGREEDMDDLYLPLGNGSTSASFQRYSDPMSADLETLSFLDPSMLSQANTGLDGFRTAHDDSCLDRPKDRHGHGLTSNPGAFHHRVPASNNLVPRARTHSFSFPQLGHNVNPSFCTPDLFGSMPFMDYHQTAHSGTPFFANHSAYCNPFGDYSQNRRMSMVEDDGISVAATCANDACADDPTACSDRNCTVGVTPDVATAAYTLASFGGEHEEQQSMFSNTPGFCPTGFSLLDTTNQDFLSNPQSWSNALGMLQEHLRVAHSDPNDPTCTSPCPIDNPMWYHQCHFPHFPTENVSQNHVPPVPDFWSSQVLHNCKPDECGVKNTDPQAFVRHFNQEHRPFIFGTSLQASPMPQGQHIQSPPGLTPSSSMSPLDVAIKSVPLSPATLSSPCTPLPKEGAAVDVPFNGLGDAAFPRPSSSASMTSQITMTPGDEYKCFWCDSSDKIDICGIVFRNADELHEHVIQSHVKNLERKDTGFSCGWQQCRRGAQGKKGFPQRSKIERHMQTHTGSKPYACDICDHVFSAKQALEQHKLIHENSRPLKCDFPGCNRTFRQQSALTMHKRTHTGEKPLVCDICHRAFSESSNLSKHKRTHDVHGRFQCSYEGCKKNFHRLDQLRRHQKQHELKAPKTKGQTADAQDQDVAVKEVTADAGDSDNSIELEIPVKPYPEEPLANAELVDKLLGVEEPPSSGVSAKRRKLSAPAAQAVY